MKLTRRDAICNALAMSIGGLSMRVAGLAGVSSAAVAMKVLPRSSIHYSAHQGIHYCLVRLSSTGFRSVYRVKGGLWKWGGYTTTERIEAARKRFLAAL